MDGQTVIIGGGSDGLGREMSRLMVLRGADVLILARSQKRLDVVKAELWSQRTHNNQTVQVHAIDLSDPKQVEDFVSKKLNVIPSHVFCIAGGAAEEIGLFADISSQQIISCFQKNYFTAVFLANAMIKLWVSRPQQKQARHLVFTNSTACFMALPGYGAYTPTKTAIRALADTLRQEVIMYESIVDIRIHCSFPGTILTEAFTREQEIKPEILKLIEGTDDTTHAQTAEQVAKAIISGVDNGHFFIPTDTQTRLLLNNMRGPSPAQTYVVDWLMALIGMIVWPFYRMFFDYTVRQYGKKKIKPPSE